jgi:hypothetical protein
VVQVIHLQQVLLKEMTVVMAEVAAVLVEHKVLEAVAVLVLLGLIIQELLVVLAVMV